MVTRIVLTVAGIIAILVGLDYLLATESAILSFNLGDTTEPARFFARTTGAAVLAIGVINILSLAVIDADSPALLAVVIGNIVFHSASLVGDFSDSFERSWPFWGTLIVHAVFVW